MRRFSLTPTAWLGLPRWDLKINTLNPQRGVLQTTTGLGFALALHFLVSCSARNPTRDSKNLRLEMTIPFTKSGFTHSCSGALHLVPTVPDMVEDV